MTKRLNPLSQRPVMCVLLRDSLREAVINEFANTGTGTTDAELLTARDTVLTQYNLGSGGTLSGVLSQTKVEHTVGRKMLTHELFRKTLNGLDFAELYPYEKPDVTITP